MVMDTFQMERILFVVAKVSKKKKKLKMFHPLLNVKLR